MFIKIKIQRFTVKGSSFNLACNISTYTNKHTQLHTNIAS